MNNLDTADRLMLLQGIRLIEDGLHFLEWMKDVPNENSYDGLNILKDRFEFFKECALQENNCNMLILDKAKQEIKNIDTALIKEKDNIGKLLDNLRTQILVESRQTE